MADFKSLWQNTQANLNTVCHLLNQSLGFCLWIFEILQRKAEENGNCLDTSEENRMACKAAVGVLANPNGKDKTGKSTHYFEP